MFCTLSLTLTIMDGSLPKSNTSFSKFLSFKIDVVNGSLESWKYNDLYSIHNKLIYYNTMRMTWK